MGNEETNSVLGYGKSPWVFKGSALYQLHLVKAETARAFIPREFKLVEAFGYTLGGFFLANYEDSPAGIFDELVVIAGIVWNPPTSCAWAARVLVSSEDACVHGRKEVGLPSQVANFTKTVTAAELKKRSRIGSFLDKMGLDNTEKNCIDIKVKEMNNHTSMGICSINLAASATPQNNKNKWLGPAVKISLPSFSGRTEYIPELLKYSCKIECRLRAVAPAKVSGPDTRDDSNSNSNDCKRDLSISVMLSKPILALEFTSLIMEVAAPKLVLPQ